MAQITKIEISPYLDIFSRRKWWIILAFVFTICAAAGYLYLCPKTYKATTLVLLEPQRIPETYVKSTVSETMEGRLSTIDQQIGSRTNIEKIIEDFGLGHENHETRLDKILQIVERLPIIRDIITRVHHGSESKEILIDKLVQRVRNNLYVELRSGSSGGEHNLSFEVSFEWDDQDVVAPVTNTIVNRFIESNLIARQQVATSTSDFMDSEAASLKSQLEAREKELEAFQKQNMGMLPDQLQSNITILNQLRQQLTDLETRTEQERQQAMFLKSQMLIASEERRLASAASAADPAGSGALGQTAATPLTAAQLTAGSIDDLEAELDSLRSMYTEKYPDIVLLERRIEELKKQGGRVSAGRGPFRTNPSGNETGLQLAATSANVESSKRQMQELQEQIELYKQRIEREPQVELELNNILRGYKTVRERYDNLLSRKLDAKMAEQLELRKKGEQFRVLDPAVKPPIPFKPKPVKVMLLAIVAGLGLGFGLAFLREMMDPTFYSPEDVSAYLKTEVIATLPVADK